MDADFSEGEKGEKSGFTGLTVWPSTEGFLLHLLLCQVVSKTGIYGFVIGKRVTALTINITPHAAVWQLNK